MTFNVFISLGNTKPQTTNHKPQHTIAIYSLDVKPFSKRQMQESHSSVFLGLPHNSFPRSYKFWPNSITIVLPLRFCGNLNNALLQRPRTNHVLEYPVAKCIGMATSIFPFPCRRRLASHLAQMAADAKFT